MSTVLDKVIGVGHFLLDRTPDSFPSVPPKPRRHNLWRRDGVSVVSRVHARADVKSAVEDSLQLLGGLDTLALSGRSTFVKPNFNSPDPFPGSTDLGFLRAVIELLLDAGAKATIGESSGGMWRPTRKALAEAGLPELARSLGVELIAFDDRPDDWVRVDVPGDYLRSVTVPRSAYEAEVMLYLPCMKTHMQARFSLSLKLGVGLMHPGERRAMHMANLEEKSAEINLVWQPDLIIMDGRKAFVTRGPDSGQVVEPRVLLASGDLVAMDLEALKTLQSYPARNHLTMAPEEFPQITTALRHGLGESRYVLLEAETQPASP